VSDCASCRYLGRNCGGPEGVDLHTVDPMSLTSKQLTDLACTLARVGTLICDLAGLGHQASAGADAEPPYIWDIEEPHAHY